MQGFRYMDMAGCVLTVFHNGDQGAANGQSLSRSGYAPVPACRSRGCASEPSCVLPESLQNCCTRIFPGSAAGWATIPPGHRSWQRKTRGRRRTGQPPGKAGPDAAVCFRRDRSVLLKPGRSLQDGQSVPTPPSRTGVGVSYPWYPARKSPASLRKQGE